VADMGEHRFTYSLLPHTGDFREETVRRAYELNVPMLAAVSTPSGGSLPATHGALACDADHVVVEAVKKAEDSDSLIVRVYEWSNRRGPVTLTFDRPITKAEEVDLLERPVGGECKVGCTSLGFAIAPYEIRTFAVRL
jgi:alpha-mannosidase